MKIAICDDSLKDAQYLQELCFSIDMLIDTTIRVYSSANKLLQLYELNCKVKRTGRQKMAKPRILKQLSRTTIAIHFTTDFKINLSFGEKVNLAFSPY